MKNPDYNEVLLYDAKPNKLFPEWVTVRMRFLQYKVAVPCACCGRKARNHWTMVLAFKAAILGKDILVLQSEPKVHPPLTPVCRDHPLEPMMPELAKAKKKQRVKPVSQAGA